MSFWNSKFGPCIYSHNISRFRPGLSARVPENQKQKNYPLATVPILGQKWVKCIHMQSGPTFGCSSCLLRIIAGSGNTSEANIPGCRTAGAPDFRATAGWRHERRASLNGTYPVWDWRVSRINSTVRACERFPSRRWRQKRSAGERKTSLCIRAPDYLLPSFSPSVYARPSTYSLVTSPSLIWFSPTFRSVQFTSTSPTVPLAPH